MSRMQADLVDSGHHSETNITTSSNGSISASNMIRHNIGHGRKPRVCVVGAGVAGLRCADILLQHGVQVTVLEGRRRVGGRLCQAKVGNHLVDLGPNWIHGTVNNPILDLIRATGTLTNSFGDSQATWDRDGKLLDANTTAKYSKALWATIGEAFRYSNENSAKIPKEKSLMDFIKERFESGELDLAGNTTPEGFEIGNKQLLYDMAEIWGAFVGGMTDTQSLKYLWLEECLEGDTLFCAGTYKKVLDAISRPALDAGVIKLGKEINRVISHKNSQTGNPAVEIRTHAGDINRTFDEVVLTAPLGWLKRNRDAFEPALPEDISQSIESLGYGNLDKIYITFPEAFWEQPAPDIYHDTSKGMDSVKAVQEAVPNTTATVLPLHQPDVNEPKANHTVNGETHPSSSPSRDSSTANPRSSFPGFASWLHPTYAHTTNPHLQAQECINLSALPAPASHPTLLFYTTGPTSAHIAQLLRRHAPDPTAALLAFFAPYISRLPNFSAADPRCRPVAALATAWTADPLAGCGSYTNFPTGLDGADAHLRTLRRGLPERGVWLAGEHCAPFVALGTLTGALWSGESVARRICEVWGLGADGKEGAGGAGGGEL